VKTFVDTGTYMGIQAAGVAAIQSWKEFVPPNVAIFRSVAMPAVAAFRGAGSRATSRKRRCTCGSRCPMVCRADRSQTGLMEEEGVIVLPGAASVRAARVLPRVVHRAPARMAQAAERAGRVLAAMQRVCRAGCARADV
jgi:LL-diaminopimelate aminotransferase